MLAPLIFMKGDNIMVVKTIKYTDYDGNEREETFYFNLNEAEITEMQYEQVGGLREFLDKITKSNDNVEIMKMFKKILLKAYGEKSADGRRLVKSEEISTAFTQTEAYNQLFLELVDGGDEAMSEFINAIIPQSIKEKSIQAIK